MSRFSDGRAASRFLADHMNMPELLPPVLVTVAGPLASHRRPSPAFGSPPTWRHLPVLLFRMPSARKVGSRASLAD